MKVIIDIDKDYFEILKYEERNGNNFRPIKIIANGTPLEEELEKLKAEFEKDKYILLNQTTAIKVIDNRITQLKGEQK